VSLSCGMSATEPVSAPSPPRLKEAAIAFGTFAFDLSEVGDSVFRGNCRGLSEGWSLSGGAICDRPVARLQGSYAGVSTGGGRAPNLPRRSEKPLFFLFGPVTDT
jgi:hypothetical protein